MVTPHAVVDNFLNDLLGAPANPHAGSPAVAGRFTQLIHALKALQTTFGIDVQPKVASLKAELTKGLAQLEAAFPEQHGSQTA